LASKWELTSGNYDYESNYKEPIQDIKLVQVSGPTVSILTRSEVKNYLKIGSDTTDDDLVDELIKVGTSVIERELGGISICDQTWKQYQKGGVEQIELLRTPVIGVPTVSYYEDFDTVTATNITYTSHFRVVENRLVHVDGLFEQGRDLDGYVITFKAGLFTASDYTSSDRQELQVFKNAINRTIAYFYENREEYITEVTEGEWQVSYSGELPTGIKRLIMPFNSGMNLI
jgi:uncharacterized phiE125 gp8 family phage protein